MDYHKLVEAYEKLGSTSKRLEKTMHISELLKSVSKNDLGVVVLLLQGRVFPSYDETKIGVASKLVLKAIVTATGIRTSAVEQEWKKTGDLGEVAKNLVGRKKQATLFSEKLSVKKVFENIQKIASLQGEGAVDKKTKLIAELLTSAEPVEAKYIVRTVLEDLRVGVASGTLRDAIVWTYFAKEIGLEYDQKENNIEVDREKHKEVAEAVQEAVDVLNDFAEVAGIAKEKGLKGLKAVNLEAGKPVKVMLYQKATGMEDAFERVGTPCAVEYKYDGFRMQVSKDKSGIRIFTRRLDEVTKQFPEIVKYVKEHIKADSFILDGEAVGFDAKTGVYLPFQSISQRIKRKYDLEKMAKEFPVELNVFDILYLDGESMLKEPLSKRRKLIEKIIKTEKRKIVIAKQLITSSVKEAEKFYRESLDKGNEGVMLKRLDAVYKPGSRVGFGVKVKPVMESLDLVIVGAEWGEGKRSGWLSSITLACYSDGEFLEIGKLGTGIKEKEEEGFSFGQLTTLLKPLIISEKGREVVIKPKVVIEVNYEEIQKSPTYSSGFALRFPRFVRLRDDKGKADASSLKFVKQLYEGQ